MKPDPLASPRPERTVIVPVRLTPEEVDALDRHRGDRTRSEVIREALFADQRVQ